MSECKFFAKTSRSVNTLIGLFRVTVEWNFDFRDTIGFLSMRSLGSPNGIFGKRFAVTSDNGAISAIGQNTKYVSAAFGEPHGIAAKLPFSEW